VNCLAFGKSEVDLFQPLPIATPPLIDGKLDEASWAKAPKITDFFQRLPKEGEPATQATEVYFLYTATDFYIGVRCYQEKSDKMVATVMKRDDVFGLMENEQFVIAIDSYNDGRNGYWFSTNPLSVRVDAQFFNEGDIWVQDWDAIWECQSRSDSAGWTSELRIPFSTLRFEKRPQNIMGINLYRRIIRTNEQLFSPLIPRQYPNGTPNVSIARKFLFEGITGGRNLYLQPYVLGGRQRSVGASQVTTQTKREIGGEVRYSLSSNLTANLTFNTDFAQVELDDRQINLTRFSLFFPEKRDFFLENAGLFAFGIRAETELFFSRTIGLAPNAQGGITAIPILAGGKLTGRVGSFELGMMNVQTRSEASISEENFSVGRMKYQIFPRSFVGLLVTNKVSGSRFDNLALGLDANLLFTDDLGASGFLAATAASSERFGRLSSSAFNLAIFKQGERSSFRLEYTDLGKNFNPEMGFLLRSDVRKWNGDLQLPWYVESDRVLRVIPSYKLTYFVNHDGKVETSFHQFRTQIDFQSTDQIGFFARRSFDYVPQAFSVFKSVTVPAGNYTSYLAGLDYQTKPGRRVSIGGSLEGGGLYDGTQITLRSSMQWKASQHLTIFQGYETARVSFPRESFQTQILQTRINYALNTKFFVNSLLQYDNASEELGLNLRLNYLFSEGTEMFLVYNEVFDQERLEASRFLSRSKERSLILKFKYLLNF
jgi:hypothetical protein